MKTSHKKIEKTEIIFHDGKVIYKFPPGFTGEQIKEFKKTYRKEIADFVKPLQEKYTNIKLGKTFKRAFRIEEQKKQGLEISPRDENFLKKFREAYKQ